MNKKIKPIDVLVIGSGLSSLVFLKSYLKKRKKVDVVSPDLNLIKFKKNKIAEHITKILPPQMIGNDDKVKGYFYWNKINLNKIVNYLDHEFGGLSNYWGLQMDPDILNDLKICQKNKERYVQSFELLEEFNLAGKFKKYENSFKKDEIFQLRKRKILH